MTRITRPHARALGLDVPEASATEETEQAALVAWFDRAYSEVARWLIHVPNGGKRDKVTAARLKALGVRRGVPDLLLFWPTARYIGLAIEMKRQRGGRTSSDQHDWTEHLTHIGWRAVVCAGFETARQEVINYLED